MYSICTKNYRDAYDFVIDSWLEKTDCDKIYIFTDDSEWKSNNEKIIIEKIFEPSTDWIVNVGRKSEGLREMVKKGIEKFVFLDIDCFVLKDINIFNEKFDIGVVRYINGARISTGVMYFNNLQKTKEFVDIWEQKQINFKQRGIGLTPHNCSFSQESFDKCIRELDIRGLYDIKKLSFDEFSLKIKDRDKHKTNMLKTMSEAQIENDKQKMLSMAKDPVTRVYENMYCSCSK
jgi:hypothetical protein